MNGFVPRMGQSFTILNYASHTDSESKIGTIRRVKYREIVADNLHKAGWSLGWVSTIGSKGTNNLDC
jgi:hypothetical protein